MAIKITEKQLLFLWECLKQHINTVPSNGGFAPEEKWKIYSEIVNQQSEKLLDIKDESDK